MISYLRGAIIHKAANYLILEVNGLGYQIYVSENLLSDLKSGTEVEIYTHHVVREDASDLYGFKNPEDLELFELLLSVSGVGPKSALAVLAIATASDIKEAIIRGDANLLTKVSGIGKKTAERIVLELKTKVARIGGALDLSGAGGLSAGDELEALMSLGFSLAQAREALNAIAPEIKDSAERVKIALKNLNK
ncbi:MAG: Holliday junction branch migration protein RuvA [Candidatus Falkowbacteria bacterium]|nr:Holliday junction branch migration protein RuvA [Candidatus Falkowbacteria bacterium]